VLDMDYSDLRTKDFLFCFDHFTLLREFRIVASDMSDRVIEMLAPHDGPNGRREIRLSYLKELELYHCQRVTGGAVVNALRERASFVDRSPTHPPMDRVTVVGCTEVMPEHSLALSAIFGSRFHSSSKSSISVSCKLHDPHIYPRLIPLNTPIEPSIIPRKNSPLDYRYKPGVGLEGTVLVRSPPKKKSVPGKAIL
jgi:hypothetical protein